MVYVYKDSAGSGVNQLVHKMVGPEMYVSCATCKSTCITGFLNVI